MYVTPVAPDGGLPASIRIRGAQGQGCAGPAPEVVAGQRLSGTISYAASPSVLAVVSCSSCPPCRGRFRPGTASPRTSARAYQAFTAALSVEASYVEKVGVRSLVYSAISGMLQTLDPHSSFFDPRTTRRCASAGRPLLRPRHHHPGHRRRHHRGEPVRGLARVQEGLRRGDIIAQDRRRGRQGLDHRTGVRRLRGPKGRRSRSRSGARLRPADRARGDARRAQHPDVPGRLHDRRRRRLRPDHDFAENTNDELWRR